jgi:DNA-directed RNA polymerase subunit RPC12/RpoP
MKKRFTFKCWNEDCKRTYTLFKEITKEQELIVACPYCNAEAVVKLEPFKKKKQTVLRGTGDDEQSIVFEYDFPEVFPTEEPQ